MMIKGLIILEDTCVCVCLCVPNVRALKNIKQKLTELKHETYSATIIVRQFNIPLSTMKL